MYSRGGTGKVSPPILCMLLTPPMLTLLVPQCLPEPPVTDTGEGGEPGAHVFIVRILSCVKKKKGILMIGENCNTK